MIHAQDYLYAHQKLSSGFGYQSVSRMTGIPEHELRNLMPGHGVRRQPIAIVTRAPEPVAKPKPRPSVSVKLIQSVVADHYGLDLEVMLGKSRKRTIARPRQMAMYISKKMTRHSFPELGRRFGGLDHTTVLHAYKETEKRLVDDDQLREDMRAISSLLSGEEAKQNIAAEIAMLETRLAALRAHHEALAA